MKLTQIIEESFQIQTLKNQLEEIGIETSDGDKSFLKGLLTAGGLAALLGSPEAASATHEALSGAADNVGNFFHNTLGSGGHDVTQATGGLNTSQLAQQGYYFDKEDGYWINPDTGKYVYGGAHDSAPSAEALENAKLKAKHGDIVNSLGTGAASAWDTIENNPITTIGGSAAALGAGYHYGGSAIKSTTNAIGNIINNAKNKVNDMKKDINNDKEDNKDDKINPEK